MSTQHKQQEASAALISKAKRVAEQLEALYPETPIPLDFTDVYSLLVAVMLSAQTTDKKVNEVTPALFDAAPTPASTWTLRMIRNRLWGRCRMTDPNRRAIQVRTTLADARRRVSLRTAPAP